MSEIKDEPILDVQETYSKVEKYIIDNQKSLSIIIGAVVALVGGYIGYKYWYVAGQEEEARKEMYKAEAYFEMDSLDLAINGNGTDKGFLQIADEYGVAPSGNLAHYYLGISYLKKGEFENAIEHLTEFSADDQIIAPMAIGATGDAHMELGKTDEAIAYYLKAAEKSKNNFTSPMFLKKAAIAYEEKGSYADAVKIYERIKADFTDSNEGKEMDKYIARAQAAIN
ncbi:MAG: tetratricopeptide repeat protein [Bacteroidetes bacterium]|nr:tetratricopeptide repeat protein [Bacteroidota bacterium]